MTCDTCVTDYDRLELRCAYCEFNPEARQDNYKTKRINLSDLGLGVDYLSLNTEDDWGWHIEEDGGVFYLLIYFEKIGIQLKRVVIIPNVDGFKWFNEKTIYIAELFNLPKDKCTMLGRENIDRLK